MIGVREHAGMERLPADLLARRVVERRTALAQARPVRRHAKPKSELAVCNLGTHVGHRLDQHDLLVLHQPSYEFEGFALAEHRHHHGEDVRYGRCDDLAFPFRTGQALNTTWRIVLLAEI